MINLGQCATLKIFECHMIDDVREGPNAPKYFNNLWQVSYIDMKFA